MKHFGNLLLCALLLAAAGTCYASTLVVNFETVPPLPPGPSTFAAAGPAQTITVPDFVTFTGGVVLGDAVNFPAQTFATPPNVYATSSFGDPSLQPTLTISINPSFLVSEVSFPLFNGLTTPTSYVVNAFSGATQVASQSFTITGSRASGFVVADLLASNITSVRITPTTSTTNFDFEIDTVAFNESVQQAVGTPEPSTFATGMLAFLMLGVWAWRRT